jgi:predicted alpha/beta-hydrolase family hydrolase
MEMVAQGLVQRGITVVRFNFAYMERSVREGKRRPPDAKARLLATCSSMVSLVVDAMPAAQRAQPPLVVGGKSMGGRMRSLWVAENSTSAVASTAVAGVVAGVAAPPAALVYFGYPLHPPGKPETLRTAHLAAVGAPQLFVSGTRDSLARLAILEASLSALPNRPELHLVEGGDHSLTTHRADPHRGADEWLDAAALFILRHTAERLTPK